jgi:hypothetical protein
MTRTTIGLEGKAHMPTAEELRAARAEFERIEPRALFYRAAIELVESAWRGQSSLSLAEATAVLLKTWNQAFYRYHPFNEQHFSNLEALFKSCREPLAGYRQRDITSLTDLDAVSVKELFTAFEDLLYPVGAAKCLHLLAPRFFPLWDRAIATAYGLSLGRMGENAGRYWLFMQVAREQIRQLGKSYTGVNPLKSLDEYNYCVYTKHLQLRSQSDHNSNEK